MRLARPTLPPRLLVASRVTAVAGLTCAYLTGMAALGAFAYVSADLPDPSRLWEINRPPSVQFVDRQGRDLTVRGAQTSAPLPVESLPAHLRQSVLATEDRRFYSHSGVDPYGLARAVVANMRAGHVVEGGSTLTQQLTKNVFLTPEQTLTRKAQEMIVAIWLERRFTKRELLRLYLDRVYFGAGAWGVEAASDTYFGRPPDQLSLPESALLAGLLKAPSALNPRYDADAAAARMRIVLRSMARQDLFGDGVLEAALSAPVSVRAPGGGDAVDYVVDWAWPEIERRVGVPNRDLVVQLTVDGALQRTAHASLAAHLDPERNATQGAVVVLGDQGDLLAMVGGADYRRSQFNRAVQAKRQPGSAFKPFVYLAGLRAGLRPWTVRTDAPVTVEGWTPRNFKKDHAGPVTLEAALARSINTVAVQVSEEAGRDQVVATAALHGLDGLKPYASLALGAQGVTPLDLAEGYLPFATGGDAFRPYSLVSIATAEGLPLYDHAAEAPRRILSPEESRHLNRMLVTTVEAGTGRRARVAGRMVAGKTGTTNDSRDAWFAGYAPGISAVVWIGNDEAAPMPGVTGGTLPAQVFSDVMGAALAQRPVASLPQAAKPDTLVRQNRLDSLLDRLEQAATTGQ